MTIRCQWTNMEENIDITVAAVGSNLLHKQAFFINANYNLLRECRGIRCLVKTLYPGLNGREILYARIILRNWKILWRLCI